MGQHTEKHYDKISSQLSDMSEPEGDCGTLVMIIDQEHFQFIIF